MVLGAFIPIIMVTLDGSVTEAQNKEEILRMFEYLLASSGFLFLLTVLFWRKGMTRESVANLKQKIQNKKMIEEKLIPQEDIEEQEEQPKIEKPVPRKRATLGQQFKHFFSRPYLVTLVLIFGIGMGAISGGGAVFAPFLVAYGYEEVFGGLASISTCLGGSISMMIYGVTILKKKWQYNLTFFIFFAL